MQSNSELRVVTRDGDILGRDLVVGGSKSESSLIELRAVIDESEKSLRELTHNGERLRFEISALETQSAAARENLEKCIAQLNESDAHMAALAEQMGLANQNVRAASAEAERLATAITEAQKALEEHRSQLTQLENEPVEQIHFAEPDTAAIETKREAVAIARSVEMESRLALRTSEERATSTASRAEQLEKSAQAERDSKVTAIARR